MTQKTKEPLIITFDIETAPITAFTWDLYPKFLSIDNIVEDWFIISACWKVLGKPKVHSVVIDTLKDDYNVCKTLRDALAQADAIVGHNSDKFDIKKLNARLIYHKIAPLPQIPQIDTCKEAKKVAYFTSNKLDYLGKHLLGSGKVHVDYSLWLRVMAGSKKALKEMVDYNKVDVVRDEELYLRLRPYMKNHPHIGVMQGTDRLISCPKCGSTDIKKNGIRISAAGVKKQECQCQSCGGFHRVPFK